jgi:hypothetical protein
MRRTTEDLPAMTSTPEEIVAAHDGVAGYVKQHWPEPKRPAPMRVKASYWRDRAQMAWPGLEIEGDGQFAFVSQCEKIVHLFAAAAEARGAVCWASDCDPIRGHQCVKIRYLAPLRVPGDWDH